MKVLALDFDGVISDSARESFVVARQAYLDLVPGSDVDRRPEDELFESFLELMPLGNRAEDFGTAMAALDEHVPLADQDAYDRFLATRDPEWLSRFHQRYYQVRYAYAQQDPAGWRALMRSYGPFVKILRRKAGDVPYAIATAKDRHSVDILLEGYGIADLFPPDRILDKETGRLKTEHLRALHERLGLPFERITFMDDKVNHLDHAASLGVRCALAGWGYNGAREHELAESRGYLVCSLDDVEEKLWGST